MDVKRCEWAMSVDTDAYRQYHDDEWGVPVADDRVLFEFLTLEGAQAGLSWSTILNKRAGYQRLFEGFEPERVAGFGKADVERLLADPSIVRHRGKIESTINNARALLSLQDTHGSFASWLWDFVDGEPIQNAWRQLSDIPATTELSDRLSKALKKAGFRFVGSTTLYAFCQAVGLVNDHQVDCFRHAECKALGVSFQP